MIHETGFDDTFYYFGNERQIRVWPVVEEFLFIQSVFSATERWQIPCEWDEWPEVRERLIILVVVETDMHEHSLRCQAGMALNLIARLVQQC